MHVSHLIQSGRHGALKSGRPLEDLPVVVLIVHLRRDMSGESFPLVFDRLWKVVFVDSLTRPSIELGKFSTKTVSDIFKDEGSQV